MFADKEVFGTPTSITIPTDRPITITSSSTAILRNVQFTVPQGANLTFGGSVVVDDINLTGDSLLRILVLPTKVSGIDYAVKVNGGVLNTIGNAHIAAGSANVTRPNRGIVITGNGSIVNLGSSGTYDHLTVYKILSTSIPVLDKLLDSIGFTTTSAYPTVWGRDAAVYSEPGVSSTINITDGTYSNQKDKSVNKGELNGAISTSGTVNIAGTGNVKISNTKIGNGVDSSHNGVNTGGTLNINNPNAVLDPKVEGDTDVERAETDSWALELRGTSTVNLVAGNIQDTLHTDGHKVIESESTAKVNILNTQYTDESNGTQYRAKIENRGYYIEPTTLKSDGTYTAWVNADASASDPTGADNYKMQTSNVAANSDPLAQLQALASASATDADGSSYTTGRLNAAFANVNNQAVYGTKVISDGSTNATPFQTVNGAKDATKKGGTVTLYGAPWTGTYKPGDTAPEQAGKLFAGWYTSQSAFSTEDNTQATSLNRDATGTNPKHHTWQTGDTLWNNTLVLDHTNYDAANGLYAHFVDANTINLSAQTATADDGTRSVRFLSAWTATTSSPRPSRSRSPTARPARSRRPPPTTT
ncbi:hypothetical protein [Bifidobacterium parmae]|uniref:hypothetical protein n=1 Tax=Bifidobacterium parmae TaxID=361854 RepID=UPI001055E564|nr:hypothetical protein [Bifidobacterium parmae]